VVLLRSETDGSVVVGRCGVASRIRRLAERFFAGMVESEAEAERSVSALMDMRVDKVLEELDELGIWFEGVAADMECLSKVCSAGEGKNC
jgi:hypothetical protein